MINFTARDIGKRKVDRTYTPHTPYRLKIINDNPALATHKKISRAKTTNAVFAISYLAASNIEEEDIRIAGMLEANNPAMLTAQKVQLEWSTYTLYAEFSASLLSFPSFAKFHSAIKD